MSGHVVPLIGRGRPPVPRRAAGTPRRGPGFPTGPGCSSDWPSVRAGAGPHWPRVAAAVLLLRGVAGDDRVDFARRVGVSVGDLEALELGSTPPSGVPALLRQVPDLVDWGWVDAG